MVAVDDAIITAWIILSFVINFRGQLGSASNRVKQPLFMSSDPRFSRLRSDPRFRRPRKNKSKVVIDDRFKSVFAQEKKSKNKSAGEFRPPQFR